MKKLFTLAFTATLMMLTQLAYSQNIILINGQASEVILNGDKITSVLKTDVQDHMLEYDNSYSKEDIQKAALRLEEQKKENNTASIPKDKVLHFIATPLHKPSYSLVESIEDK